MKSAVLVAERRRPREVLLGVAEPLTAVLALSLAILGALLGWHAHREAETPRTRAPAVAEAYVDALCRQDVAHLQRRTRESLGPLPWEPRLSEWAMPCTGHRYLGSLQDRIGREQHVFTLFQPDGTEVVYLVTIGRDGLVAGVD